MLTAYKLPYILREPCEDNGNMYEAEVPILPGCMAWGETAEATLEILESVAAAFIESYKEHGDELPAAITEAGELVVAV